MSTKEALQSLQSRLAERLQAVQTDSQAGHWLGVLVSGHRLLIPLAQAGEIFPWSEPLSVAYTQPWFLGVSNLRGVLCGVVHLPLLLKLTSQDSPANPSLHDKRLVALHPGFEINAVLAVDLLLGLKNADQFSKTENSDFLVDTNGQHWQPLDLSKITQTDHFLNIAAT